MSKWTWPSETSRLPSLKACTPPKLLRIPLSESSTSQSVVQRRFQPLFLETGESGFRQLGDNIEMWIDKLGDIVFQSGAHHQRDFIVVEMVVGLEPISQLSGSIGSAETNVQ